MILGTTYDTVSTSKQQATLNHRILRARPSSVLEHSALNTINTMEPNARTSFLIKCNAVCTNDAIDTAYADQYECPDSIDSINWPETIRTAGLIAGVTTLGMLTIFAFAGVFNDYTPPNLVDLILHMLHGIATQSK